MSEAGHESGLGETMLRPVRPQNAFEETVQRLLQTIRLGVIHPGDSLPAERELASRLGVSRDTVRDAIKELSTAGYLESRRGRYGGTFVVEELPAPGETLARSGGVTEPHDVPSADQIEDVLVMREVLEVGTARLAATRTLSAEQRAGLWQHLERLEESDPADYRRLDSRLHLAIAELVASPSLTTALADARMQMNALLDDIPLLARNIAHSNEQHRQIVTAILTGDAERSAALMTEHLEGSAALLRGFLG